MAAVSNRTEAQSQVVAASVQPQSPVAQAVNAVAQQRIQAPPVARESRSALTCLIGGYVIGAAVVLLAIACAFYLAPHQTT